MAITALSKSNGQRRRRKVRVYTASGEIKDGEWLKQLLSDTDRALYEAIYSFDVFDRRRFKLLTGTKSASFSCIRAYSGRKRRQSLTGGWQKNLTGCISRTGGTPLKSGVGYIKAAQRPAETGGSRGSGLSQPSGREKAPAAVCRMPKHD